MVALNPSHPNYSTIDEKTFRKWKDLFVRAISLLESKVVSTVRVMYEVSNSLAHSERFSFQIIWSNRFMNDLGNDARVTIDGTDMHCELRFDKRFYSHKFNKGGLKYELGLCIRSGSIVWINGPFRCGMPDITVSRQAILYALSEDERVEADLGYRGEQLKINTPNEFGKEDLEVMKSIARSRHETVNGRMKVFGVLAQRYRHDIQDHSRCFRAVAVIVQLNIETDAPLFIPTLSRSIRSIHFTHK